jgi:transglutaminase-like putative cysteine protease
MVPTVAGLIGLAAAQTPTPPTSPRVPQCTERLTTKVDFAVVVTPPYGTKLLRVWLPIPPSDALQTVRDRHLETWPMVVAPQIAREPVHGNEFAYFEFAAPKGAQMIRHQFVAETWQVNWDVDPRQVVNPSTWPSELTPYLRSESQAVTLTDRVHDIARTLTATDRDAGNTVLAALRWVDANMRYDHGACSLAASSAHALEHGCGHCSDYHGLTAALGRALQQPARVAYGYNLFAKNSPSHCKAEVLLPPYGWVAFDVSETQRQVAAIAADPKLDAAAQRHFTAATRARTERGFRDNTWLLVTRGSDYDLMPPASKRVAVVRTIYAEADGVALPEPDPGDARRREFAWMTMHTFTADRPVGYAFHGTGHLPPATR